ncbi:MAG: Tex-like N-terminal domain-containing protein, partial [Planctomycetota bacterium]
MTDRFVSKIAEELSLPTPQVAATAALLQEGATIPFIARYRKEATGSLDEVAVAAIRDRLEQLQAMAERREAILKSLAERNLLTDELTAALEAAETLAGLEDIYQPYRPKRRTRAMIAKEKGLDPLADLLWAQEPTLDPGTAAQPFVNAETGVESAEAALAGARDILAERASDDTAARTAIRALFAAKAILRSCVVTGKETEGAKFRDYFEWEEPATKAPSHRILAIRRGEAEKMLTFHIAPPEDEAIALLTGMFVKNASPAASEVRSAVEDGYKRLLGAQIETETRLELKQRADAEAIRVFTANLRELLLASPLGQKIVLGVDPGYRTGCKVVCLDRQGKLLHHDVVYVEGSERQREQAAHTLLSLCARYEVEAIAIGNGTASRETEAFVRGIGLPPSIAIVMVNESGASVYSASAVAREEFPEQDITVRGAVSIGRRLMDPLAELVKIDPKSI